MYPLSSSLIITRNLDININVQVSLVAVTTIRRSIFIEVIVCLINAIKEAPALSVYRYPSSEGDQFCPYVQPTSKRGKTEQMCALTPGSPRLCDGPVIFA